MLRRKQPLPNPFHRLFVVVVVLHPHTVHSPPRTGQQSESVELAWVLLTSSNVSKAAHGYATSRANLEQSKQKILSWELGVLLLPSHFASARPAFHLSSTDTSAGRSVSHTAASRDTATPPAVRMFAMNNTTSPAAFQAGSVLCPVPYSLPPVPYRATDELWTVDAPYMVPDRLGRTMVTQMGQLVVGQRLPKGMADVAVDQFHNAST